MGKHDQVDRGEQARRERVAAQRQKVADDHRKLGHTESAKRAQQEADRVKKQWNL